MNPVLQEHGGLERYKEANDVGKNRKRAHNCSRRTLTKPVSRSSLPAFVPRPCAAPGSGYRRLGRRVIISSSSARRRGDIDPTIEQAHLTSELSPILMSTVSQNAGNSVGLMRLHQGTRDLLQGANSPWRLCVDDVLCDASQYAQHPFFTTVAISSGVEVPPMSSLIFTESEVGADAL